MIGDFYFPIWAGCAVGPGEREQIDFEIASTVSAERAEDMSWLVIAPGGAWNAVMALDPVGYLTQPDLDAALTIRTGEGTAEQRRFALMSCPASNWVDAAAPEVDHFIDLAAPPLPGVPVRICPN